MTIHKTSGWLAGAALALAVGPAAGASSSFETDTDGWTAIGDAAGPVTWVASGGNPDGHVEVVDAGRGDVMYFVAPAEFLGDQSAAFGKSLGFDLMQIFSGTPSQFDSPDVVLKGAGLTLVYDLAANPGVGTWTSYSVLLSGAGWTLDTQGGAAATDSQMHSVLVSLTELRIRAEYRTGSDTDALDNVNLPAVAEPATWCLALAGLGVLVLRRQRR